MKINQGPLFPLFSQHSPVPATGAGSSWPWSPSTYLQLLLASYGPADTQVSVMLCGGSITQNTTLRPDVTVPLPFPASLELTGSHTSHKTLVVEASADISVTSVSTNGYTVGAIALLPMESLGIRYYVVTPVGS